MTFPSFRRRSCCLALVFVFVACGPTDIELTDPPLEGPDRVLVTRAPVHLRADGSRAYWALEATADNSRGVFTCVADDCARSTGRFDALWASFSASAGWVAFTDENALWTCPGTGCLGRSAILHPDGADIYSPVTVARNVYFHVSDGLIYSCGVFDCGEAPSVVAPSESIETLVPSGGALYYFAVQSLLKVPIDNSGPPSVVVGNALLSDKRLAVAGNAAFWRMLTELNYASHIYRCELPDCSGGPTLFATTGGGCWSPQLVADEVTNSLYWLDECDAGGAGVVKRCPFSGCESEPEVVTQGPPAFVDFALTEHDLWLSPSAGSGIKPGILRRPR